MADDIRLRAWHDTLTEDERDIALRVGDMPPSMAFGWLAVRIYRIEQCTKNRPKNASLLAASTGGGVGAGTILVGLEVLRRFGLI